MKDIKKHFATFDSYVKMKLVPNVRDIRLRPAIFVHGCNDQNFGMKIYYDF